MGYKTVALAIACIVMVISTPAIAYCDRPRHVDPAMVPQTSSLPFVVEILTQYSSLVSDLNMKWSPKNIEMLKEVGVPQNFASIINKTLDLYHQYVALLNETVIYMDSAERSLALYKFDECREALHNASRTLKRARMIYTAAIDALNTLRSLLGPLASRAESIIELMGTSLSNAENRLNELYRRLEYEITISEGLLGTRIIAHSNATVVLYGDTVEIRGKLIDSTGAKLVNKTIIVQYSMYLRPRRFTANTTTDSMGEFRISIPLLACGNTMVELFFVPQKGNLSIYRNARASIQIYAQCYEPSIKIHINKTLLVGRNNSICIESNTDNLLARIRLPLLGVERRLKLHYGMQCTAIHIPASVYEGVYRLLFETDARRGVLPVNKSFTVLIRGYRTTHSIDAPKMLFTGLVGTICVTTQIPSNILLYSPDVFQTSLSNTTRSCTSIQLPMIYFKSTINVIARIMPLDHAYKPSTVEFSIHVVNTPVALFTVLLFAVFVVYTLRRKGVEEAKELHSGLSATNNRVEGMFSSSIVREFIELLEKITGLRMEFHMTLREYIERIQKKLEATAQKTILSCLSAAERILYGPPIEIERSVDSLKKFINELKRYVTER